MVRLDFLSITGETLAVRDLPLTVEEAVHALDLRNWDHAPKVRAVRVTDGRRIVIRRRPTDAYGPGHLPRIRATSDTPRRVTDPKRAKNGL